MSSVVSFFSRGTVDRLDEVERLVPGSKTKFRPAVWVHNREGKRRALSVYSVARTIIERHIKVRGEANPYKPEYVEYFEKRRCFAWRTYPVEKVRAFAAGNDKLATQDAQEQKPDCRIGSAETELRKA